MVAQRDSEQMAALRQLVQKLLNQEIAKKHLDFKLTVAEEPMCEAEWIYFVVVPDREDVHVYEYASALSSVETKLRRDEHVEKVLLVPALPED